MVTSVDLHRSDFNFVSEFTSLSIPPPPVDADILWRDQAGDNVVAIMNNNTPIFMPPFLSVVPLPFVPPDWHVKATAQFDVALDDADILWENDTGALAIWQLNVGTVSTAVSTISTLPNPGPTWHVVGDNDFTGAQRDNILFQNDNGALAMWTGISAATGTVSAMFAGTQNPGPTWHVVGTGDTTNDGRAGILWQNDNGALALWEDPTFAAGTFTFNTVAALPTVDPSWHVKGMADVSGDLRADVVFQNDNGAVVVWEMGDTTISAANLVNLNPGPTWHIVGMRDMDGDRHADILFQNDNGAAAVWEHYHSLGGGSATFNTVLAIDPNPNPNGHVWDLL